MRNLHCRTRASHGPLSHSVRAFTCISVTSRAKVGVMDASKPSPDPTGKLRVLIIDDEKNIRTTLSLCLEQMDCYVKAVSSVEAALAALRHESFDVAFLDLRLGEANGLEIIPKLLAESVRTNDRHDDRFRDHRQRRRSDQARRHRLFAQAFSTRADSPRHRPVHQAARSEAASQRT